MYKNLALKILVLAGQFSLLGCSPDNQDFMGSIPGQSTYKKQPMNA